MSTLQTNSFLFFAATSTGKRTIGVRQAATDRALAEVLRKEKMLLLRSYRLPRWATTEKGLRLKDRAALNEQLAQLLSRGVPLVEALEVTASAVGGNAKPIIERMRELVAAGSGFGDACQRVGVFDRVTVAVYRAAERTGDLAGAAKQLAITARRQLAVSGKAATLMIYPMIVLAISVVVVAVMMTVIVPRIGKAMSAMGAELPWFTQLIMDTGEWMRGNVLVLMGVVGFGAIAGIVLRKKVAEVVVRSSRRVPLLKDVVLAQESARFFSVMAAMTRSGVPLADALGVANDAVGHPELRRQLSTLRTKLIEGGVLRALIENVTVLPLATRRLLIAAERAGDMETAFDALATDMADETDRRATRLLAALEPTLIVGMFLIIGTILVAIMVPLMTMASQQI
ncbi:MAG: type II secretion system F family protein [Phycisphaeraceae bacterium]|nr:type II secretion system F family protein [Phycisphaeraceae bacterium]